MVEANRIKEIYSGHYQVILDFPSHEDLVKILDESYTYVWGTQHNEVRSSWRDYDFSLYGQKSFERCQVRNIEMEFLVDTESFMNLIPNINRSVHLVQTNVVPPHYLNLGRLEGKRKYDMLKEKVDYLLEIQIPGSADYSPLVSPNLTYLEMVIERFTS